MVHISRSVPISLALLFHLAPLAAQQSDFLIVSITISGNQAFPEQQLMGLMRLKIAGLLSGGTPFSRRALKVDALTLKNFYLSHGYLEAQVADSFAITTSEQVKVYLKITEGQCFTLAEISMTGNRLLAQEEIFQFLGVKTGEPYNPVILRDRLGALRYHYQDRGKLAIDILEEIEVNDGVHLRLLISEGLTYALGNVTVTGLKQVPEWYVTRELLFHRGDIFNRSKLLLSQQRVFESGLFGAVEMIPMVRAVEPGIADIEVRVRELERRSIDLSAGFKQTPPAHEGGDPNTALNASVQWWHSRIFNTSVRTGLTLEGNLILENFWPPDVLVAWDVIMPWTLGVRLPTTIRIYSDFRATRGGVRRDGVDLSFLSKRLRRSQLRGSLGWVDIHAGEDVPDSVAWAGVENSIKLEYLFQGVDNLLQPRRGTIFQLKPSLYGTFVEDVREYVSLYYKLEADVRRYRPSIWRSVFAYRLKIGYLGTLPSGRGQYLKRYHLYDLGGSTSLRGWNKPDRFSANGGVLKGLVNIELRSPLLWILGAEIFLDAGAMGVFLTSEDSGYDPEQPDLKWETGMDMGAGFLLTTPLGPIRIDAAWPLGDRWTGKPTFQVAFLHTF